MKLRVRGGLNGSGLNNLSGLNERVRGKIKTGGILKEEIKY